MNMKHLEVDEETHRKIKARAAEAGMSIREFMKQEYK